MKAVQTEAVQGAQLKESSRLRSLLGVLGAGLVLLFVAVSIGEAIRSLRTERSDQHVAPRRRRGRRMKVGGGPVPERSRASGSAVAEPAHPSTS